MERIGLFSEMEYITIGDKYVSSFARKYASSDIFTTMQWICFNFVFWFLETICRKWLKYFKH